jgi:hypothetical protein
VPGQATSKQWRIAGFAVAAGVVAWWTVLAVRQIADGGFYSDDFAIQWDWDHLGYGGAVDAQFDALGSKPLLAFALPGAYELFGADPTGHHVLAVALALATAIAFYFVLRELGFEPRDAVPIALLALMFPWASGVRLWPTGSLNNLAVLLLFAGFLAALRGLRLEGPRRYLVHAGASALLAAAVLTYDATAVVAAMLWPAYVWRQGWRRAAPLALMDVAAVGAAIAYTRATTNKDVREIGDQLAHIPDILAGGAKLVAASLVPASAPADLSVGVTVAVLAVALGVLVVAALRRRPAAGGGSPARPKWPLVAAVAVAALVLCWAVFVPQAFYTPTFRGLEDRVNVLALYPAAVLVWAVLRAAGGLLARHGYLVAAAGAVVILTGYGIQDGRQERDWARAAELQEPVLASVERAPVPPGALVLVFGQPGETAPGVPVFNASWDLHPAALLRTDRSMHAYPVFEGARLKCAEDSLTMQRLPTPLYWVIFPAQRGTDRTQPYGNVVFVDAASGRSELIASREQCERGLEEFRPGPFSGDRLRPERDRRLGARLDSNQ